MTEVNNFTLRSAEEKDLSEIIRLLIEDDLGTTREHFSDPLLPSYREAFRAIRKDNNQLLLIVEYHNQVIGACHLTFMPSLSFKGSWRLNIENVHVDKKFQNQGVGKWMLKKAMDLGRERGCKIVQLTTNKKRFRAKAFYEKLGFEATHEGMKLYL
ncbi:MAG: GNAT family N-acetyltransferase [Flavobacteriales bacterium]|nr:GNAT family N-acetyltransferase [Flavobacteriales bacterium]